MPTGRFGSSPPVGDSCRCTMPKRQPQYTLRSLRRAARPQQNEMTFEFVCDWLLLPGNLFERSN